MRQWFTPEPQVLFCTPVPRTIKQMTFRLPQEEDYFGSYLRQNVFQNLLRRELTPDMILGRAKEGSAPETETVLTDDSNPLSEWQDEDAPGHWQREFIGSMYLFHFPRRPCHLEHLFLLRSTGYSRPIQFRMTSIPLSTLLLCIFLMI